MWGIFSYAEVGKAAMDTTTFSGVTVPPGSPRILPLMADPPEHTPYKHLMASFFRLAQIATAEAEVRPIAGDMIDALVRKGGGDFAQEFAYPFSTRVLCKFLKVKEYWQIYYER
jgi:cytochrome P450